LLKSLGNNEAKKTRGCPAAYISGRSSKRAAEETRKRPTLRIIRASAGVL